MYYSTIVDLFVDFRVDDSDDRDDKAISIKQVNHIKSLFVNILHWNWNIRYSRHHKITNCVSLEPFLLTIHSDVVSSFNDFRTLVFDLMCRLSNKKYIF